MTKSNGQTTGAFSISKEFKDEIPRILGSQKNSSRFICEAIIEKHQRETNPKAFRSTDSVSLQKVVASLDSIYGSLERLNETTIHQIIDAKIRDFFGGILTSNQKTDMPVSHIVNQEPPQDIQSPSVLIEKPPTIPAALADQPSLDRENTESDKSDMRNKFGAW